MKKFIKNILAFLFLGMIIGELIIRLFGLSLDVPTVYKDESGLIKMDPNQEGRTIWGHKWVVNTYGEYGYEPKTMSSIFTVIGDSYIANTVNPPQCHQAKFLSTYFDSIDFFPSARNGASFIEYIIMAKNLDSLKPKQHLLYVENFDFIESIIELNNNQTKVQWSYNRDELRYPIFSKKKYNAKRLLYEFKFIFYIYRNYLVLQRTSLTANDQKTTPIQLDYEKIRALLDFIRENFESNNITLVFKPNSDDKLISMVKDYEYKVFELCSEHYESWQLDNDPHWSCYGHKQVASQVANYIKSINWE